MSLKHLEADEWYRWYPSGKKSKTYQICKKETVDTETNRRRNKEIHRNNRTVTSLTFLSH